MFVKFPNVGRVLSIYRIRILFLVCWSLFVGLLDLAGLGLLIKAMSDMASGDNYNLLGVKVSPRAMVVYGLLLVLARLLLSYMLHHRIVRLCYEIRTGIRSRLLDGHLCESVENFKKIKEEERLFILHDVVQHFVTNFLLPISRMIVDINSVLFLTLIFLYFQGPSAGMVALAFVLVSVSVVFLLRNRTVLLGVNGNLFAIAALEVIRRSISNHRYIILSRSKVSVLKDLVKWSNKYSNIKVAETKLLTLNKSVVEFLFIFLVASLLVTGDVTEGSPVAAISLLFVAIRISAPISNLLRSTQVLRVGADSVERLEKELEKVTEPNRPSEHPDLSVTVMDDASGNLVEARGINIRFDETYLWKESRDFGFQINQWTLITGPSGSGKSTLLDVILGLKQPSCGKIFVSQSMYSDLQSGLIGYVAQDPVLFGSTAAEIVTGSELSRLSVADTQKYMRCLAVVDMTEHIERLKQKVGINGANLSGGQRQRVAIARALFNATSTLVFDEPTSALDSKTCHQMLVRIQKEFPHLSAVVVSHDLSLEKYFDRRILV